MARCISLTCRHTRFHELRLSHRRGGGEVLSSQSRVRSAARLLPLFAALPAVQSNGIAQALPRDGIVLGSSQGLALVNAYQDFVEGRKKEVVPRKPCLSRSASRAASPKDCTSSWAMNPVPILTVSCSACNSQSPCWIRVDADPFDNCGHVRNSLAPIRHTVAAAQPPRVLSRCRSA